MKNVILSLVLAAFLLGGCKTTHEVQYVDREVVRYADRLVKDSIYIHNTDTVKIEQKGDTVYSTNIKWRVEYKDRIQRDTFLLMDSVKIYIDKKEIVNRNKWGILDWIGLTALLALIVFIAYKLRNILI